VLPGVFMCCTGVHALQRRLCVAWVFMCCNGVYFLHWCLSAARVCMCYMGVYVLQGCIYVARVCMCYKGVYVLQRWLRAVELCMQGHACDSTIRCNTMQHPATHCNLNTSFCNSMYAEGRARVAWMSLCCKVVYVWL